MAPGIALALKQAHGDNLIDNARQFARGLAAFHLRLPGDAAELIGDTFQNADHDRGLAGRMLQVLQQPDHFTRQQAIGAARIGLAGLVRKRLGPRLGPGHGLARQIGDAVQKDDGLAGDQPHQIGMRGGEVLVMRLGEKPIRISGRVHAANQAGDGNRIVKASDGDAVAPPILDGFQTGFEVDADRLGSRQCFELRCLADTAWAKQRQCGFIGRARKAFIGRDNAQCHQFDPSLLGLEPANALPSRCAVSLSSVRR